MLLAIQVNGTFITIFWIFLLIFAAAPSVSHHRALSLPITTQSPGNPSNCLPAVPNNKNNNNNNVNKGPLLGPTATNFISSTAFTIQPIHQRTRSLPLTEETAIQLNSLNSNPSPRASRDSIYAKNNKSSYNDHHHHHQQQQQQQQQIHDHIQNTKSNSSMSISSNPNTILNETTGSSNVDSQKGVCTCTVENRDNHQNVPTLMTTMLENSVKNDELNNSAIHSVTFYNNIDTYGSHNDKLPAYKNIFNNKVFMGGGFIQSSYVGGLTLALQRGRSGNNCGRSMYFIILFLVLHFFIIFFKSCFLR